MRGVTLDGQPKLQVLLPSASDCTILRSNVRQAYYHRPLHELFRVFFSVGLVMDALEEPVFAESDASDRLDSTSSTTILNFQEMPPVLGLRMRKLQVRVTWIVLWIINGAFTAL